MVTRNICGVIRHVGIVDDNFLLQDFSEIFSCMILKLFELFNLLLFLKIALIGQGLVYSLIESFILCFLHLISSPVLTDPQLHEL